jgi:hypothetical protein
MSGSGHSAALVAIACLSVACGSEPAPRSAGPSLLGAPPPSAAAEAFPTPAVWRYQPREAAPLLARIGLPNGGVLFAGERGERWRVGDHKEVAEGASEMAPEDLVAIVNARDGGFLFLGRSGTSYESKDPVGPFVRSSAPLEPLVRVRAAGGVLVGIRRDGAIVRSDSGGAAWSRVGPEGVRFQDVAIRPDGHGIALGVPESSWETADFGASFKKLETGTFGATALVQDDALGVVLATALGPRKWEPGSIAPVTPLGRPASRAARELGAALPLGPSATALTDGRAIVVGDRLLEVRPASESSYRFITGTFGAALDAAPFPLARGCADVRLAGNARAQYVACAREKKPAITQPLEIHRSLDLGRTWVIEPYVVEGRVSELSMVVAGDGALVLSGVCPSTLRGPGCAPVGVQRREFIASDAGKGVGLAAAATPSLAGSALGLVASLDGRVLYALGRRSKSESLAVFVSRDHGATFDARDAPSLTVADDDRGRSQLQVESLAAAEDGTVSFVVAQGGRRSWLVVDEDGRTLALTKPPVEGARIGAAGARGLAIDPSLREAWESLDGGATFSPLGRLPVTLTFGAPEGVPKVACVARGCVIGDVLSRIGWRPAPHAPLLAPPPTPEHAQHRPEPRVGTPLTCTLDAGEWRKLPGAIGPPFAEQAAIGRFAWFTLRHDPVTAAVAVSEARLGHDGAVEEVPLFPPAKRGVTMAYTASIQIEGVAALRYPAVGIVDPRDPNLRHVEVAWDDALFGRVGHAVIPDGGPFRPHDYDEKGKGTLANPALLSIASGGVYVRLHGSLGDDQPTYFVDGRTLEVLPPVPWPPEARRGRGEMVRIGHDHVPIRLDGSSVLRARRGQDRAWAFDAISLGLAEPKSFGRSEQVDIAYVGEAAGLHLESSDLRGKDSLSRVFPFRAEGALLDPPTIVPTQLDLPATPRPCSAGDRTSSPRVVAPIQPGTRHPVIVTDPIEPQRVFLTDDAVLHGTPASPCAAAYEATLVSSEAGTGPGAAGEEGIVFVDPGERSWLFRAAKATADPAGTLEYRAMSCRFDPAAEVPIEVFREKGTLIEPH